MSSKNRIDADAARIFAAAEGGEYAKPLRRADRAAMIASLDREYAAPSAGWDQMSDTYLATRYHLAREAGIISPASAHRGDEGDTGEAEATEPSTATAEAREKFRREQVAIGRAPLTTGGKLHSRQSLAEATEQAAKQIDVSETPEGRRAANPNTAAAARARGGSR